MQEQREGTLSAAMLTGPGIDERYVRSGELVFTDLLGSTVALSNGSSNQTTYAYDPYGVSTSAGAATNNTYQFTGRENDGTTAGLMFYRARYYNPAWGRFVSEDPIGVAGGVNLYGYVEQDPTDLADPHGNAGDGTPRTNTAQNKQIDEICKRLKLNPKQRDFLHKWISKQNMGFQEILEEAESLFKNKTPPGVSVPIYTAPICPLIPKVCGDPST